MISSTHVERIGIIYSTCEMFVSVALTVIKHAPQTFAFSVLRCWIMRGEDDGCEKS